MNNQTLEAAPWFGRSWEHKHALFAGVGSFLLCAIYAFAVSKITPDYKPGAVEFFGTATSLWSVWITQKRNVLALPIGIVSVVLMGWFFKTIELNGQMLLHWVYYLPVQIWAWHQWTRGDDGGELRVKILSWPMRLAGIVAIAVLTLIVGRVLESGWDNSLHTYWDASIVAASIVAMTLLAQKRVESWILWILPVNVSAIALYVLTGAYMFAALYSLFLAMGFFGFARWKSAYKQSIA